MPFSEIVKLEVKKRAAFRCCRCEQIGIDVHHIMPEKDGGSDDVDNAAPLCQSCHDQFGDNPLKRKEIRQMRDWWYEICCGRYSPGENHEISNTLGVLVEKAQTSESNTAELRAMLKRLTEQMIDKITPATAQEEASRIEAIVTSEANASFCRTKGQQGAVILRCNGDLDSYSALAFKKELIECSSLSKRVIVDMTEIEWIDSSALVSLIAGLGRIHQSGGTMEVVVNDRAKKFFDLTGLGSLMDIRMSFPTDA
jgi:anti-anti-sigma factor